MGIKTLINKSYYGTQGYISSLEDLNILESYIDHNQPIISEYKNVIVATNFSNYDEGLQENNAKLWHKYFPNAIILDLPINRGHNHGYCDLENILVEYCIDNNIEWLCKSANDTLLTEDIWDLSIPDDEVDCYYTLGFNRETIQRLYEFDTNKMEKDWFSIQGAFYFINTSKITSWHDKEYLDSTYQHIQTIENYNGKIWEYIPEFECELMIAGCINRNNLSKYYLFTGNLYNNLCDYIINNKIDDPSHKNMLIQGICHHHSPTKPSIKLQKNPNISPIIKGTFDI
tara:strand:+ start:123 stop:980 length:858 start_codon:yes stop_codon:yes gene_type:complete